MNTALSPEFYWVAVAVVVTLATSRLMRLWTYDDFPPVAFLRNKYLDFTEKYLPAWAPLGYCPWCVGFWIALAVIGLGYAADLYTWTGPESAFWTVGGALAASYVGAMIMVRDDPSDDDDETDDDETDDGTHYDSVDAA